MLATLLSLSQQAQTLDTGGNIMNKVTPPKPVYWNRVP